MAWSSTAEAGGGAGAAVSRGRREPLHTRPAAPRPAHCCTRTRVGGPAPGEVAAVGRAALWRARVPRQAARRRGRAEASTAPGTGQGFGRRAWPAPQGLASPRTPIAVWTRSCGGSCPPRSTTPSAPTSRASWCPSRRSTPSSTWCSAIGSSTWPRTRPSPSGEPWRCGTSWPLTWWGARADRRARENSPLGSPRFSPQYAGRGRRRQTFPIPPWIPVLLKNLL